MTSYLKAQTADEGLNGSHKGTKILPTCKGTRCRDEFAKQNGAVAVCGAIPVNPEMRKKVAEFSPKLEKSLKTANSSPRHAVSEDSLAFHRHIETHVALFPRDYRHVLLEEKKLEDEEDQTIS